jgi:Carboxypeptidase regulatory-like domain
MHFSRVAVLAAIFSATLFAQEFRSTISGVVTDPSGAPIGGAKVVATETRTGVKTPTVSDAAGKYTMPFLAPGQYQITAQAQGFKEAKRTDLALGADERPVIDFRLEVGDVSTTVSVSADIPLLNTDNASVGQAITTKQIEEIPLNGRTPLMLAELAIGVTPTASPTLVHPFDLGGPAAFSVAGTPSQGSELLMDGVPDETWDGRVAYNPPVDAVQEVRVKAFDSDASFGHTGGGTMNQVLKTGTNGLHGSLWEFNQPSDMVANDFFRNRSGQDLQITHFNQYGLTVGGPMVLPKIYNGRNKLFWFFAFEGLKDGQPNPTFLTVPTDAERQGNFSALLPLGSQYQLYNPNSAVLNGTTVTRSPFPGNIIPQNMLSPIALNYMKLYPEPNVTVGVGATGTNNYSSSATTTDNYSNELGRLDYNLSDKDRMFFDIRTATETQQKNNYFANPAEGSLLYRKPLGTTFDNVYVINPTTVADVRLNFTRLAETHALPSTGFDPTSLGFPSYISGDSQYLQMPIASLSTFQSLGASGASNYPSQSLQLFGDVVKTVGNHTIKFGADARQYRMNFIVDGNSTGTYSFANTWVRASSSATSTVAQGQDLASLLLGLPTSGSFDVNSFGSFYNYYAALFVQDDWRVSRNLTVNFGLHYDHDGAVHEKYGRTVDGFDPTDPNPIAAAAMANYAKNPIAQIPVGAFKVPGGLDFASPSNNAIYQNTSHLVSPRVGFAWSPEALKGTVIRGGFGMFVAPVTIASLAVTGAYSTTPVLAQEGFSQTTAMTVTNNNFVSPAATLANPFPGGILQPTGSSLSLATFNGQNISYINPQMKNPYSLRWDLGIQHTLGKNTVIEVAYIGNHSVHTPITVTQINGIPRQYLSTLPTRDAATNSLLTGTVANPFVGLLPNSSNLNGSTTALVNLLAPYPEFPVGDSSGGWSGSGGVLEQLADEGRSYYHSLNIRLERRLSKGLSTIVNYGYSKLIEQDSWLNDSDGQPEKRVSPFDHPQRIVLALTYDLPVGRGQLVNIHSRALDAVIGGWHLNSVYIYQIGQPLNWDNGSTTTPGDYVYYGGPGALAASLNNQQANTTAAGTALPAFNTSLFATSSTNAFAYHIRTFSTTFPNIRQDAINEWDPSILKRISFTEKTYLQLRFEFFNMLNHPNFAAPGTLSATSSAFGVITAVANRPRTIQLGARFVF